VSFTPFEEACDTFDRVILTRIGALIEHASVAGVVHSAISRFDAPEHHAADQGCEFYST
jgi:hypothetical protein